jgi:hypothetical protein
MLSKSNLTIVTAERKAFSAVSKLPEYHAPLSPYIYSATQLETQKGTIPENSTRLAPINA